MTVGSWRPGRDRRAQRMPGPAGLPSVDRPRSVAVIGGGIAGLAAATGLAERGVQVTLLERRQQLGGRVRSWPTGKRTDERTMSRGFHAFFRQYYNLRALLRRADPGLAALRPIEDYPLRLAGSHTDSFSRIPRTPPWNLAGFVATSPSFGLRDLGRVDLDQALALLDVDFPQTFIDHDGDSAAALLDRLRFPDRARHLALEVFARSFFSDPDDFSAGELVAMFHSYFVGSAEGLLFDVPREDYNTALWAPLGRHLVGNGVRIGTGATVTDLDLTGPQVRVGWQPTAPDVAAGGVGSGAQWAGTGGRPAAELTVDAVVVALDPAGLRSLITDHTTSVNERWRQHIGQVRSAPPFAVWRMWLDRPVDVDRAPFLGTSGYGPLDNISVLERFEAGAADWAERHHGSVVEVHAYALPHRPDRGDEAALKRDLWEGLASIYPEVGDAQLRHQQWLVEDDCPLISPAPWCDRPTVVTPDPRLMLAGDTVRCDLPVALMERAATTGFQAANQILAGWRLRGHDLWSVPTRGRHRWPGLLRGLSRGTRRVGGVRIGARRS